MTSESKPKRLSVIARELNVGTNTIVQFLEEKGYDIPNNPNSKVPVDCYNMLLVEYSDSISVKEKSIEQSKEIKEIFSAPKPPVKEEAEEEALKEADTAKVEEESKSKEIEKDAEKAKSATDEKPKKSTTKEKKVTKPTTEEKTEQKEPEELLPGGPKLVSKIDLDSINQKTRPKRKTKEEKGAERKAKVKEKEDKKLAAEKVKKEKEEEKSKKEEKTEDKKVSKKTSTDDAKVTEAETKEIVEKPTEEQRKDKEDPQDHIETKIEKLTGPNVVGKIDINEYLQRQIDSEKKKAQAKEERIKQREKEKAERKSKRKRIKKGKVDLEKEKEKEKEDSKKAKRKKKIIKPKKPDVNEEDVQKQIKETLARLTSTKQKSKASKYRREKRDAVEQKKQEEFEKQEAEKNILQVTEFVSVNELANMMNTPVTNVIATCMSLGLFVSINQRLDAETMSLVADEYGYEVKFLSPEGVDDVEVEEDAPEDLTERPPIVTVMGHVDHGKTKLLDTIRRENVVAGEAGGITQHIGAYSVKLDNERQITFLDTPGHEAFTAMRARGAQITDVVIIIIAADDNIMPQTVEAINHASAAGVPIIFAINKIDKPNSNPEKVKEELANMNYLVEDWGGKYQSQEISALKGTNVDDLLEKVLLESDLLELKANPAKNAVGTVVESALDKGRGYVATLLVQAGTLKIGDILLAGCHTGRVKAMYNERGQKVDEAGPSTPVLVLGLNGAPQAGDKINVMKTEHEAREIANKRLQLQREQGLRTQKHITLDEIGRRLALGDFNEINIIVKGDVDGSIEALSDSLIKLSTDKFNVNIIHKAVGQVSESDVMLAAASNAIIVGFQVRPSVSARKLAEKEEIEIRTYSIIYDAINEIKDAMQGMLSPVMKEQITGTVEIREIFKITKVGTIGGCMVTDGKISRKSRVRVIRDGIVIYTGELGSLKRFKDDVKEVSAGYECGLNIDKFNDIKVGDIVEAFEEVETQATL